MIYALVLQSRLTEAQSALAVLVAPDVARIDLAGQAAAPLARARALWSRDRGMVFSVTDLPPAPEGRVYQVWVVTSTAPISAGLLTPDASGAGSAFFETDPDIRAARGGRRDPRARRRRARAYRGALSHRYAHAALNAGHCGPARGRPTW